MVLLNEQFASADERHAIDVALPAGFLNRVMRRTGRRFVALHPMGFELILINDGVRCHAIDDTDDLASRLDTALAREVMSAAPMSSDGTPRRNDRGHWLVYDQDARACFAARAPLARRLVQEQ